MLFGNNIFRCRGACLPGVAVAPSSPRPCLTLPGMANVLPVTWQSPGRTLVHSPHCRAAGSGPAPLSYPSICLGAIHFAVIEFLWRVIFIQRASQHLWILIAFLHKEKEALC